MERRVWCKEAAGQLAEGTLAVRIESLLGERERFRPASAESWRSVETWLGRELTPDFKDARVCRNICLFAQAIGVVVLAVGMHTTNLTVLLLAGIAAGLGAGGAVQGRRRRCRRYGHTGQAQRSPRRPLHHLLPRPGPSGHRPGHRHRYTTTAMTWFTGVLLATIGTLACRPSITSRGHGPPAGPEARAAPRSAVVSVGSLAAARAGDLPWGG